jgi:hypothetical protein
VGLLDRIIARAVRAPMYEHVPTLTCWYFSYWRGVPVDGIELQMKGRRAMFVFPTNDDLTAVAQLEPPAPDVLALGAAQHGRPDDTRLLAMAAFGVNASRTTHS